MYGVKREVKLGLSAQSEAADASSQRAVPDDDDTQVAAIETMIARGAVWPKFFDVGYVIH